MQQLLQQGLGIFPQGFGVHIYQHGLIKLGDDGLGLRKARVQKDSAKNGFQRVCQNGGTTETTAFQLPFPQTQIIRQTQTGSDFRQSGLFDQIRSQAGQIAFINALETVEQQGRNREVQDRIPQELQPLVMASAVATMGQGLLKQACVFEGVADSGFKQSKTFH